jgi:hypothetical protein
MSDESPFEQLSDPQVAKVDQVGSHVDCTDYFPQDDTQNFVQYDTQLEDETDQYIDLLIQSSHIESVDITNFSEAAESIIDSIGFIDFVLLEFHIRERIIVVLYSIEIALKVFISQNGCNSELELHEIPTCSRGFMTSFDLIIQIFANLSKWNWTQLQHVKDINLDDYDIEQYLGIIEEVSGELENILDVFYEQSDFSLSSVDGYKEREKLLKLCKEIVRNVSPDDINENVLFQDSQRLCGWLEILFMKVASISY